MVRSISSNLFTLLVPKWFYSCKYLFLIPSQIRSSQVEEYNGVWPRDSFTRSSKITQAISSCFTRPFKFEYSSGRIGNIYAPEDCPDLCVNIVRGILNMLQITIKKSQNVYELQEVCVSHSISKTTLLEGCVLVRCSSFMCLFIWISFQAYVLKNLFFIHIENTCEHVEGISLTGIL